MNEAEALKQIIEDDSYALISVDDKVEGFTTADVVSHGSGRWNEYIEVITAGPSGKFYSWSYEKGLTESQEDSFDFVEVTEVLRTEVQTVVVKWVTK